ncbi:putative polysaccharide biosynthesis protein [Ruoffia tabacinasalis]|uniref:Oligosaccharide flippase family protein n=1 Tax=Ruoffia tabacinasalis TaxID=87458 RepID=A0ABS0LLQ4_9LACT|nr:polysaccharide biosynthesis protein [Ruoffia tabacinasalis]MBG9979220.1 oligosaccharide flippase family protein [Ruoffia tabacinasalis]
MSKQHNDQDNSNDLSNQQPYNRDEFQTIEFTEEEKNILRRPNRQPIDGDYFAQSEMSKEELENLDRPERDENLDEARASEVETSSSTPTVNEFRYKSLRERNREQEMLKKQKEQEEKQKSKERKKIFGDVFKPTYEERYDLTELEDITDYNQFQESEKRLSDEKEKKDSVFKNLFSRQKEDRSDVKVMDRSDSIETENLEVEEPEKSNTGLFSSVKNILSSSDESNKSDEELEEAEQDAKDNLEFEESVNQTDWLNQDNYTEELATEEELTPDYDDLDEKESIDTELVDDEDQEVYPAESGIEASYQPEDDESEEDLENLGEDDAISITELGEDESQLETNSEFEDETTDSNFDEEEKVNSESDSEPDIDEQFKDKDLTDEELDQLSEKISQDTDIIENPILTDQVLNEYYSQNDTVIEERLEEESDEEDEKSGITSGASWLTIGNVLSRVIGALYVIPWATWLGAEYTQANVLYSAGYKPYSLMLAIATAGFPSSIAKQMAYYHSLKEYKTADKLFKNSIIIMLLTGVLSGGLLFLIAPILAENTSTTNVEGATMVIRSLSPALLILPAMSLLRGYFQGFNDMKPTAISQIIEQFARVGYLLAATYAIMMIYSGEVTHAVVHSTFAAFIGALGALLYLIFEYIRRLPVAKRLIAKSANNVNLDFKESIKIMVVDSIPFILLGSGIIIAQLIDTYTFGQILESTSALLFTEIEELYGVLSLDVDKLVMIIISLAVALASSLVPVISKKFAQRNIAGTSELVEHITVLFSIVMIPAALGMASIANNIYYLFYPNGSEAGPGLLITASISSIVLGAYTVFSTILQSMNYRRLAVRFLLIGLVVKALLQFPFVALFEAHGALVSTAIGFLVSTVLMWIKLSRELDFNYRRLNSSIIKILIASALMTVSAAMWNQSLNLLFGPVGRGLTFLKIVIVIIMAVLVYGSILGITNMLSVLIGNRFKDIQDKMRLM